MWYINLEWSDYTFLNFYLPCFCQHLLYLSHIIHKVNILRDHKDCIGISHVKCKCLFDVLCLRQRHIVDQQQQQNMTNDLIFHVVGGLIIFRYCYQDFHITLITI